MNNQFSTPRQPQSQQPPQTPMSQMPASIMNVGMPKLQNIVSTINLGCALDLKKIATQARNAEYNPKRFAAVIIEIF